MRKFHLGDILSVTVGVLVSPRGEDGLRDVMAYVSGDEGLLTAPVDQLQAASGDCMDWLVAQHPVISGIGPDGLEDGDDDSWAKWLERHVDRFGEELWVQPSPAKHRQCETMICLN